MKNRQARRIARRSQFIVIVTLFVVVLVAVFLVILTWRARKSNESYLENKENLLESVKAEQEKGAVLDQRKDKPLEEEDIIDIAHERFGLVFPNEVVLMPKK